MKSSMEIRNNAKSRKPSYLRRDAHKKIKIGKKWRKPKGHHNKFARHCNHTLTKLEVGYKSPVDIRGANKQGLFEIIVSSIKDLDNITNKKTQVAVVKRTVGLRKRIDIINLAKSKGITIVNIKNPEEITKKLKVKKESPKKEVKESKPVVKEVKKEKNDVKAEEQKPAKKEEPKKESKVKNESK